MAADDVFAITVEVEAPELLVFYLSASSGLLIFEILSQIFSISVTIWKESVEFYGYLLPLFQTKWKILMNQVQQC